MRAYPVAAVRAAEEPLLAAERGFANGLMHRAAFALEISVSRELAVRGGVVGSRVVALVGGGNNGGDTLYALAGLARRGVATTAVLLADKVHDGGLAALRAAGGQAVAATDAGAVLGRARSADLLLDGLLGIGAKGGLRGLAAQVVTELCAQRHPPVIAVDVPSGIGVDDGTVPGPVLPAERTVTFGAVKPGLLLPPAAHLVGQLEVVDLSLMPGAAAVVRLGAAEMSREWPVPAPTAHKYRRGVLGVVAGAGYPGAAVLTVAGALGAGCGMVRYLGPEQVLSAVLAAHPEVVAGSLDAQVQAWVIGPGLSGDEEVAREALHRALSAHLPVVVDAGALDLLPERVDRQVVLTPHAGELARLLSDRDTAVERAEVAAAPLHFARRAAELTGATVLLKGNITLIVGDEVISQPAGPTWLATAGSGDVLAGVIGALLAAGPAAVGRAAAAAVAVHGRAALLANPGGPVASGAVAAALPAAVADLLRAGASGAAGRMGDLRP